MERVEPLKDLARDLAGRAAEIADGIDSQIDDRYGSWADNQMDALFAADHFAAGRTFYRLAGRLEWVARFREAGPRRACRYLLGTFRDLESAARGGARVPSLYDCSSFSGGSSRRSAGTGAGPRRIWTRSTATASRKKAGKASTPRAAARVPDRAARAGRFDPPAVQGPRVSLNTISTKTETIRGGMSADIPQETLDKPDADERDDQPELRGLMVIEPGSLPNQFRLSDSGRKKTRLVQA